MEKYDPIVVEEIASDDEWITKIEGPVLPEDPTWLEDELLYNVEAVRNVPTLVYEGGSYIREPRESSPPPPPPPREPTPPPCEPTPPPSSREPTQPRGPITYKRKWSDEESSSRTRRNVEYDSEDSFDEMMRYPTSSSRVGNEEDDVAFYLDEEDLDE
ncbi:formin-like protein 10 [Pyrus x bretschneideri]|uniref:formin-like protein 10 n=1 Tax=Pyrus x bretschneideri TaxID=225117 RepID=UPI0020304418|nr:formin-like protein 10 [Pyrus x bretschneideri]